MKTLKTNVLLIITILLFNYTWSQQGNLPEESMTSVDIAALYVPQLIITAAKQMPDEYYTFRPTPEVRSFGELMAHIAKSSYQLAALAKGETVPVAEVALTKAEIIKALEGASDYYAKTRAEISKERKKVLVKFMGHDQSAENVLDFVIFHSLEHYGNAVVYMRLNGLIPPSSQENPGNDPVKQNSK